MQCNGIIKLKIKIILGGILYLIFPKKIFDEKLVVFVFHEVSDGPSVFLKSNGLAISVQDFEKQIIWIKKNFNLIDPVSLLGSDTLPKRPALITFDDGYQGVFEYGLPLLELHNIPSVHFLNMEPIINKGFLLSALANYLENNSENFSNFAKENKINKPYHLTLSPSILNDYYKDHNEIDIKIILNYQGEMVKYSTLKKWEDKKLVFYANHLYQHWNARALTQNELQSQYNLNKDLLVCFKNFINFFSFTNGKPDTCFNKDDYKLIENLGAKKIFTTSNGINKNYKNILLGRVILPHNSSNKWVLWFSVFWSFLK
jgi:peptidoglycan/xylan/chitin deacetylase (PgdA/CDA1 family)